MRGPANGRPEQTAADAAQTARTAGPSPAYAAWEGRPKAGPSRRQGGPGGEASRSGGPGVTPRVNTGSGGRSLPVWGSGGYPRVNTGSGGGEASRSGGPGV